MSVVVIQCDQCGGSLVYDAHHEDARCLFCGSVALKPASLAEPVSTPQEAIGFGVDTDEADAAYRRWARSSWWYAKELRNLEIGLSPLWLPAWRFIASVETHWAGLVRAPTRSGKRPLSGAETVGATTMIPASIGITKAELQAISPFDESTAEPWDPGDRRTPYEVPALSERAASIDARHTLAELRRESIGRRERLSECRSGSIVEVDSVRMLMLPIYIGGFRYRERAFRFVINAQTGSVHGRAPLDRKKVALVVVAALVVIAALILWGQPWR